MLFNPNPFVYPNDQQSTMLWYHDHTLGITRLNMIMGLAGLTSSATQWKIRSISPKANLKFH